MVHGLSAAEYADWKAFWEIDPQGEQRADLRMTRIVWSALQPHTKSQVDPLDFMPFPDDANGLPDDLSPEERRIMLKMDRMAE